MPSPTEHNLQSIYNYFINQSDGFEVGTVTFDKKEFKTFNKELVPHTASEAELKKREALSFAGIIKDLRLTLEDSVNKNSPLPHQDTLLHTAITYNRHDLFTVLLDHGANPLIYNHQGDTALLLAAKLARKEMLDEFHKMIGQDRAAVTTTTKNNDASSDKVSAKSDNAPANAQTKAEKTEPTIKASQKEANTKQNQRYVLSLQDLKRTNKSGESVESIIQKNKKIKASEEAAEKKKASSARKTETTNLLNDFKFHIDQLQPNPTQSDKRKAAETKEPVKTRTESYSRYNKAVKLYSSLAKLFDNRYEKSPSGITLKMAADNKKHPELEVIADQNNATPSNIILPYDRREILIVLRLLKEYSQFSWMHLGRRFRKEASALIAPYFAKNAQKKQIHNIHDVIELYKSVASELERIQSLHHHKDQKNNPYNSSYCRRLSYSLEQLEKTEIIRNYNHGRNSFNAQNYEFFLQENKHYRRLRYESMSLV